MGGAGEVWAAEAPGGLRVAMKIVRLTGPLGRREMINLRILRSIRHPNLLAYFGAWQTDGRLIIGMELADRSLWDRFAEARRQGLAGIPFSELLEVLFETAKVIDFLNEPRHELDGRSDVAIQHRDIKPQNIMLIGQGVKVADFGLSCLDDQSTTAQDVRPDFRLCSPRDVPQSDPGSVGPVFTRHLLLPAPRRTTAVPGTSGGRDARPPERGARSLRAAGTRAADRRDKPWPRSRPSDGRTASRSSGHWHSVPRWDLPRPSPPQRPTPRTRSPRRAPS